MNDFQPDEDFLKTLTVLYVEDDEETRAQLGQFLRRRVGVLVSAGDGLAGVEAFCGRHVDMVVTDILMPGMDGLAMAREIRKRDRNVPIVVTTAFEQTDYLVRSIDVGVDKYVTKPVDTDRLQGALLQLGHRLQQEQMAKRVSALVHKSQLLSMASNLALAEEGERRRIAEELHDQVLQNLALAAIKLDSLGQTLEGHAAEKEVLTVRTAVGDAITDLRSLTFELSPPVLNELGLESALQFLTEEMRREHGIQVQYAGDGLEKTVAKEFRTTLYRSARELMINAVKRAQADLIKVSVARCDGDIHICVEDNGRGGSDGASQSRHSAVPGFGLFNIRERMGILGGSVRIESRSGEGSRITLVAPLAL